MAGDYADTSQQSEEFFTELALQEHRKRAERHANALSASTGYCLNCRSTEHLPTPESRYCDKDCEEDHRKRLTARSRSGSIK